MIFYLCNVVTAEDGEANFGLTDKRMSEAYAFHQIEEKWRKIWERERVFEVHEDSQRPKFYSLEMYPYPSGRIHMGHVRNFTIVDVISRFKTMRGYNVLHPIGWDAFGMPAENAAIKEGVHPQKWSLDNIAHMKHQLKRLGFSYDWSREVNTCLPEYYVWNQWIFLKLFEKGLTFRKKSLVNWCPECQTVLANEQVISESCWRCGTIVDQKNMEQWFLKITDYAEELLSGHSELKRWPPHVLAMQRNWIGKSEGVLVSFSLVDSGNAVEVFTTRIDTIYGATFLVLSPEHPLVDTLLTASDDEERSREWVQKTIDALHRRKGPGELEKEGIDTGKKALNPFSREEIPIWIANYVLMDYGTGAIMAVPAHDQRDYEFSKKYSLPIREVIAHREKGHAFNAEVFEDFGMVINSDGFSGISSEEAIKEMTRFAEKKGFGKAKTIFRLRDWGISRQRYWGTPIPIIYCKTCGIVGVPYEELPVTLPTDVEFKGEEGSPLETAADFVKTRCPKCKADARRETDTMDTFFDSSWYYLRYCSPHAKELPFSPEAAAYWLPVDIYVGGVEHAILHLIYARFFCKALRDLGISEIDEPFPHYLSQGMVTKDGAAMSKSRGNVVDPDDIIERFGVDTTRLFILFASPPEREFAWDGKGIEGGFRFLNRIWTLFEENSALFENETQSIERDGTKEKKNFPLRIKLHQTVKKVSVDIGERYHLNTAISSIMELFNQIKKDQDELKTSKGGRSLLKESMEKLLLLLAPFTPHICEELWQKTAHKDMIARASWPDFDPYLAREEMITIVVQVNGKLRDKFEVPRDLPDEQVREKGLELERITKIVGEKTPQKVVYVKGKLINIVL